MVDDQARADRNEPHGGEPGGLAGNSIPDRSVLSTSEAATALGLSEEAIRRAIAGGDLAATRQDATLRIQGGEVVRFARQQNLPLPLVPRSRIVPLPAIDDLASELPTPGASLVGRDTEVARLITLLEDPAIGLVTLTGPGGIGKTRLAVAAAEAIQGRFADGARFIDLSGVTRAADAIPAIAQVLGLRETAGQDQVSQIATFLRAKDLLLILDNVEQIIDAAPEIARMARQSPGTTLLITSRAPLRVRGEREMSVPPLPLANRGATPDELLASDAGRLFVERVTARDPSFVVDGQNAPLIAEICARLDGLPLAIELAAARAKLLPPRQLRDRLERTLTLLTRGDRDAPPRHLTMRDAVAWSYDLLAPEEQRLFRRLAIFAGGFTLDAAEHVGGDGFASGGKGERGEGRTTNNPLRPTSPPLPRRPEGAPPPVRSDSPSVLDRLEALLDQSMVVREVGSDGQTPPSGRGGLGGESRFRMLETIREFGLERLQADEEEGAARSAHASYFLALAHALRPLTTSNATRSPIDRLAVDDANLSNTLVWLDEHGPAADFVALIVACWSYWYAVGRLREGEQWLERALARREAASPPDRARLTIDAGELLMLKGESARADATFAEGLALLRAVDDPFDLAMGLISSGASLNYGGHHAEADAHFEEALSLADAIDDAVLRAAVAGGALSNLSVSARGQGDLDRAAANSEDALRRYFGQDLDLAETRTLMDLAGIANDQGDLRLVVERYQACLERTGERGDMRLIADALTGIAGAASAWGQRRAAVLIFAAAAAVRGREGIAMRLPGDVAAVDRHVGELREALGDEKFAAAWDEGAALSLPGALAVAATVASLPSSPTPVPSGAPFLFTRREQEVLRLLAMGQTDRDIAEALFIGPRTVSWHVSAILGKLGVATRREAAIRAQADGLL